MRTHEEYIKSPRTLHLNVYSVGEETGNLVDHPTIHPFLSSLAITYKLAQQEEYKDLTATTPDITNKTVNRFCYTHQSAEDLVKKVRMQRLLGQEIASCFRRCVGMDAFNAIWSTTYKIDEVCGASYHQRFRNYVQCCQGNNLVMDGATTDPEGNHSLPPLQQEDPDLYVHINEMHSNGIVVTGAEVHQTGLVGSCERLIVPTCSVREDDADYVVSFTAPSDAEDITIIYSHQPYDTHKMKEGTDISLSNSAFEGHGAFFIMDHVLIPMERVFMYRGYQPSSVLIERSTDYHRQPYGDCKIGVGDVPVDVIALVADYNNVPEASHIENKLIEVVHLSGTLYVCGITCSAEGKKVKLGGHLIDTLPANICKQSVTRYPYEIARLAGGIADDLMVTIPSRADLQHEEVGPLVRKYLAGAKGADTANHVRILHLVGNLTLGAAAVGHRTEGLHGTGSSQVQRIIVSRQCNMGAKKELARQITHIDTSLDKKSQGRQS